MTDDPLGPIRALLASTMKTDQAMTPLRALLEHAAALSSKDDRRFVETVSLPFIHLRPDGEIVEYRQPGDVHLSTQLAKAPMDVNSFGQTELEAATLVLDWNDLKVFHTRLTRYAAEGKYLGKAEAICVVVLEGESWKVKLSIGAAPVT